MAENPYAPPTARRGEEKLGVDEVRLCRSPAPPAPTSGAVDLAWEHVKARPVETILLAALSTFFGGGRCSPPNASGVGDLGSSGSADGWESGAGSSGYEYFSDFDLQMVVEWLPGANLLGLPGIVAQSNFDAALVSVVLATVLLITVVFFVLGVVTQAAEDIYWLRILRGQPDDLGRSFQVGRYLLPIAVAQILVMFGSVAGMLLCIIPGVILMLGWAFVGIVAVDKNLGYFDALTASWRITEGYKLEIFLLYLIAFAISIGGALLFCVGLFVAMPVIQGAFAVTYVRIAEPGNSYLGPGEWTGSEGQESWDDSVAAPQESSTPGQSESVDDPYGAEW